MGSRKRLALPLASVCALALVVSATAAGLYEAELSPEELEGPEQPISFSHKLHAGNLGIECLYCHTAAEKSQAASVPAVSVCMGCHTYVKQGPSEGSAEEIAKIHDYYNRGESIPWVKIHNLAEYVQFKHYKHVQAGVDCQTCHGQVQEMNRVYLVPDTLVTARSLYLPAAKLEMGWCMECHWERGAPDDCGACHY